MDLNEYQKMAMRTKVKAQLDEEALLNGVMGLVGETGEVVDTLKKALFQGHTFSLDKIIEELGDVLWYVALICDALQYDMSELAQINIDKLKKRYPEGFKSEDSINRVD